jgi:hypothetical protein
MRRSVEIFNESATGCANAVQTAETAGKDLKRSESNVTPQRGQPASGMRSVAHSFVVGALLANDRAAPRPDIRRARSPLFQHSRRDGISFLVRVLTINFLTIALGSMRT